MAVWDRRHPERLVVQKYISTNLRKKETGEIIFHHLFEDYQTYLKREQYGPTMLHPKAFGKIIREILKAPRTLAWREGKCQSIVTGYAFK